MNDFKKYGAREQPRLEFYENWEQGKSWTPDTENTIEKIIKTDRALVKTLPVQFW